MVNTKSTTHTITLTRPDARWFVDAALSSIATDDITPVICAARIAVTGDEAQIVSTDRYRVTLTTAKVKASDDHEFLMPREALTWMGKNLAAFGTYQIDQQSIVIETTDEGSLRVTVFEGVTLDSRRSISWAGAVTKGNFPVGVIAIVEKARVADPVPTQTPRVNLDFIAKARGLAYKGNPPTMKFTAAENGTKDFGPLLLTFKDWDKKTYAEVLIQPNNEAR